MALITRTAMRVKAVSRPSVKCLMTVGIFIGRDNGVMYSYYTFSAMEKVPGSRQNLASLCRLTASINFS